MLQPPLLQPGDTIALAATARFTTSNVIEDTKQFFQQAGFKVKEASNLHLRHGIFAGTDKERATAIQNLLDDTEVKAIFCVRGGYGTLRIIPHLDFTHFTKSPKWIMGFSDVTALHHVVNHYLGVQSLHTPLGVNLNDLTAEAKKNLIHAVTDRPLTMSFPRHLKNRMEEAIEGEMIGGNLSILYSLLGTSYGLGSNRGILFIEEVDEYLYHIDRMLLSLRLAGKLKQLKGLVVGGMTSIKDNSDIAFPKSLDEIIYEHIGEEIPVVFGYPSGHINDNHPLVLGGRVCLSIKDDKNLEVVFE